ncbi:MAG: 16S rRNA (uracil(1498)-N(3))-methyltransferase [Prevotella sp.]|jgi:16S rRNA (uracil1498-N3)-methyltransferase|nr:16S rRNA (uracil(1498)-N(3))-methyltransferase [Prevotella sp.]MBO7537687.1 16S rRNA (uracil(1498)-N(3))-methyltransferase [Prevotella sp.]
MKETRFFYVPDADQQQELPTAEAMHAMRVLRLKSGDELFLMDGVGNYYRAVVTIAATHNCYYDIVERLPQTPQWQGHIHLAIAPTKVLDRIEWMVEKATEVGVDEITFFHSKFSERKLLKTTRLEKIAISAMKQSHKAWKPVIHEIISFKDLISSPVEGRKYIAHCYEEIPRISLFEELQALDKTAAESVTVLIGPEGDFSIDEVQMALEAGYQSVHLGNSRLRTETAGLMAVTMMQLSKQ